MKKRMRRLFLQAMEGDSRAFCKLGILSIRGKAGRRDVKLGRLFLRKAVELGNEEAYFLYHRLFSRKKKVIDDLSYEEMFREYQTAKTWKKRRRLLKYLRLGTKAQKRNRILKALRNGVRYPEPSESPSFGKKDGL